LLIFFVLGLLCWMLEVLLMVFTAIAIRFYSQLPVAITWRRAASHTRKVNKLPLGLLARFAYSRSLFLLLCDRFFHHFAVRRDRAARGCIFAGSSFCITGFFSSHNFFYYFFFCLFWLMWQIRLAMTCMRENLLYFGIKMVKCKQQQ
jgi:hypothetical protein